MSKITAKTTLKKIMEEKNGLKVLMENGVPCMSCPMAAMEIDKLELGKVCKAYDLNLEKILKDLDKK